MRRSVILVSLVLAGCGGMTPEEEEAARQQAVAEVEAAQQVPVVRLELDPIRYREIEKYDLYGAGCGFVPDGAGLAAVALAMAEEGYLIRNGELLRFAADAGSDELPYLARRIYTGKEFSFSLDLDPGPGTQSGVEARDFRGRLTVRDPQDRAVYSEVGLVQCGA